MNDAFILIVEDDPDQAALIRAAFKKNLAQSKTHFVFNGREAQAYLNRESPHHDWERYPLPSLIVLDLWLPDITGFDILEWMAERESLAKIPVIVFTGSEDPEHKRRAYELGVRRYMRKADNYDELAVAIREELGLSAVLSTTMAVTSGGGAGTRGRLGRAEEGQTIYRSRTVSLSVLF